MPGTSPGKGLLQAKFGVKRPPELPLNFPGGPRWPRGQGEGGAGEPVRGTAQLTLPPLSAHACVRLSGGASPMRQGPLPLPPEGP